MRSQVRVSAESHTKFAWSLYKCAALWRAAYGLNTMALIGIQKVLIRFPYLIDIAIKKCIYISSHLEIFIQEWEYGYTLCTFHIEVTPL